MGRFLFWLGLIGACLALGGCGTASRVGARASESATLPAPTDRVTMTAIMSETVAPTAVFVFDEMTDPHLQQRTVRSKPPTNVEGTETRTETPRSDVIRATRVVTGTRTVTATPEYGEGRSNVERAQAVLSKEGLRFALVVVSTESAGLEGEIFRDLTKRNFRATTGADEGFETRGVGCHPRCVFVRSNAVNEISTESWTNVLRHEERHMVQATNHPNLADAFRRTPDSLFTTYAAFLEACADEGIFVAEPTYHASERMPRLRLALGAEGADLIRRACEGFTDAYASVVKSYELKVGERRWGELFPAYK